MKLTSAGPVFAQRRVGHQGPIFTMLKLRSIVLNAEELKPQANCDPCCAEAARKGQLPLFG